MSKTIFQEIENKPWEYLALLFILLVGVLLFFVFSYDRHMQRRIIYATTALYFAWSIYHHYKRGDLQLSIVIEYILIGILALSFATGTLVF
ncbi:MAG: hypothetical protein ACOX6N_04765 [Patescibacteria group bacterium]|jgi:hypothetical protein